MTRFVVGLTPATTDDGRRQIDGAACLIGDDGTVIALAEERVSLRKHAGGSLQAMSTIFAAVGLSSRDIEGYFLSTCGEQVPKRKNIPISDSSMQLGLQDLGVPAPRINWVPSHHLSHALSVGPLEPGSIILVADEAGSAVDPGPPEAPRLERETIFRVEDGTPKFVAGFASPNQDRGGLGSMYRAATDYLGFDGTVEAGKTMALAAYAEAPVGLRLTDSEGHSLLPADPAAAQSALADLLAEWGYDAGPLARPGEFRRDHMVLASIVQGSLEEAVILRVASLVAKSTPSLALAGGVALNCVMVGRLASTFGSPVRVASAPGDTGQALGNAVFGARSLGIRCPEYGGSPYLGPQYDRERTRSVAKAWGRHPIRGSIARAVARRLVAGEVIALFDNTSEFGPRALGNRSILADPRLPWMRDYLNHSVKHREWFRPYGVSVLEEHASEIFVDSIASPYMLVALPVRADYRSMIAAAVHIDGTVRYHTVEIGTKSLLREVIEEFHSITGVPCVINTSFNDRGRPIVESPEEAMVAFESMNLDAIVLAGQLFDRSSQFSATERRLVTVERHAG